MHILLVVSKHASRHWIERFAKLIELNTRFFSKVNVAYLKGSNDRSLVYYHLKKTGTGAKQHILIGAEWLQVINRHKRR